MDALAAVSRVMFDQRILDLRKENEALQCEVALLRFGPEVFNRMLTEANDSGVTEVCKCPACFLAKRFCQWSCPRELVSRFNGQTGMPCALKECLLWHAQQLGLVYEISTELSDTDSGSEAPDSCARDCDLVVIDHEFYWEIQYGKRLAPENFHRKPSLPELKSLFALMEEGEDFFVVGDRDFRVIADSAV